MISNNYRLQFITHYTNEFSYIDSARIALVGGCRWIQLRMKEADAYELTETAIKVKEMCKEYGATFIVDDNVAVAKSIDADGVHLGKNDMSIADARKIVGDGFIIGGTVNSFEDILFNTHTELPNYFGCGPFRFTSTKNNLAPILGLEGYKNIINRMRENNINIPLVAIGGIRKDDIPKLLDIGVSGIALSSSVLKAKNPVKEMNEIIELINRYYNY